MSRRVRLLLAGLIIASLVLPLAAAGVSVAGSDGESGSSEYSYKELKDCGKSYESAPPSMRFLGSYGSATVRYTPVGPGGSDWNYLERGTTVHSNEITIRTVRLAPEDEIDETLNVTTVFWQKGQKKVVKGNTTTTRPVAENVTTRTTQVELGRGYDTANISLPAHYEDTYRVTMFVEENPDSRWCYKHQSVESTRSLPFAANWGGFWKYVTPHMLLPILAAVGMVAIAVPASIRVTGRGPNMGLFFWFIMLAVGGMFVGGGAYVWTTSLLASAPYVVAFLIAGIVGIVMLETMEYGIYRVALIRLFTDEKKNPRGDVAREARGGEFEVITLADTDDGPKAIRDGVRPWLARLFSGGSPLYGIERLDLEFDLGNPELSLSKSPADKLIFVDEAPEDLIDYEPETLAFELPLTEQVGTDDEGEPIEKFSLAGAFTLAFYAGIGGAVTYLLFQQLGLSGAPVGGVMGAGALVYGVFTTAQPGRAAFLPAVGMTQDATATAMYLEAEMDNYETLEAALSALVDERNTKDDLLDALEELDAESAVKTSSSRDKSPGDFVEDTSPAAAGGDD